MVQPGFFATVHSNGRVLISSLNNGRTKLLQNRGLLPAVPCDVFARILPKYFNGREQVGMSLTGGLDTRMIMAWKKPASRIVSRAIHSAACSGTVRTFKWAAA